jgi:hypothetical protein
VRDVMWSQIMSHKKRSRYCLQETKLVVIDDSFVAGMLGLNFAYFYLPAVGTHGGIILAWHTDRWCCSNVHLSAHAVTIKVKHCFEEDTWWLTTVYGSQGDQEKVAFLEELRQLHTGRLGP